MQKGAVDYVTKPVEGSRLAVTVRNTVRLADQARQIGRLRADLEDAWGPSRLLGDSKAIEDVRALVRRVAESDLTVLVTGETGTGKELVARALHVAGPRRGGPFVDVNSAAMTESLIESELFGHEKGAFTGAAERRQGKFEAAEGGTLFLDEIGDMPGSTQAKILRVLQEGSLYRTGGNKRVDVDVRVVCATHQDLDEAIAEGRFRRDLYYRISTVVIHVPPLRERKEDVPVLARHFAERAARKEKRPPPEVSPAAMRALEDHTWPGNVRELDHVMARAVLLSDDGVIDVAHLPRSVTRASVTGLRAGAAPSLIEAVEDLERRMIADALVRNGWVKARAARALGITTRMIGYKMENLGIRRS
jgi:two-component system NtrC family response regulator